MSKTTSKKDLRNKKRKQERKRLNTVINPGFMVTEIYKNYEYTFNPTFVGKHIRELRLQEKISQYELALRIGAEKEQIKLIESGNYYWPLEVYDYIAFMVFGASLSFLLTGEENKGIYIKPKEPELTKEQLVELEKERLFEFHKFLGRHASKATPKPSPEKEVEEYMSDQRDINDLSADAQTWLYEEVDDD